MAIKIPVDFTGVEAKQSVRVAEGDYVAKVVKIDKKPAKSSGNPMLVVTFEGLTGELTGKRIRDNHVLVKDSLWTLRNMLEAMGFKVKPSKMNLTDSMLMGKKVGLTVVDGDEYNKRIRSEIADYIPVSAVDNKVSGSDVDESEDEDPLEGFEEDEPDEDEEEEFEEDEEEEDDEDSFEIEDDEEEEFEVEEEDEEEYEEEVELSFSAEEVSSGKGAELKEYLKEAMEAGWEFDLDDKPKVAEVREALMGLFEEDEEDEDDDMEGFDLDDMD